MSVRIVLHVRLEVRPIINRLDCRLETWTYDVIRQSEQGTLNPGLTNRLQAREERVSFHRSIQWSRISRHSESNGIASPDRSRPHTPSMPSPVESVDVNTHDIS